MKCPNCGAGISVRDEFCAWCGSANERARRHVQILKRYRAQTDATREEIERQTLRRVPVFIRLLVIALLLVAAAAAFYVTENAWQWEDRRIEADNTLHAKEYTAQLDRLLEANDHIGFNRFLSAHRISVYGHYGDDDAPYQKYRRYVSLNGDYLYVVGAAMELTPYRPNDYETEAQLVGRIADYTNYFYGEYNREPDEDHDPGEAEIAADDMEAQLRAILVRYIGVRKEDADEGFAALTDARRKLLIEEAYAAFSASKGGNG